MDTSEQRRENRDSLFLLATMRMADQIEALRIKVRNLSSSGMMAECAIKTVRGERLMIDLRNIGWVSGTVAWVAENRFGIRFDHEIDARAVRKPAPASALPELCVRRPPKVASEPPEPDPANLRRI